MEFMPHNAPAVALGFLGTGLLLLIASIVLAWAFVFRKRRFAAKVFTGMCVLTILYGGVLLTFSLSSSEKVLDSDGFKYFCGIDCHVAYSIVDFRTSKTIGPLTNATQADGIFFIVTLQTWFDERTIANHRVKDLALTPDPRIVTLMDAQGNHYLLSERGQRALEEAEGPSSPLNHPLLPGESYTTRLAFDLPAHIQNPRLWIGDAHWATHLLVGHENSFFHKKIFFQL